MAIELKVPAVGESITEGQVGEWLKVEGEFVKRDEPLVIMETDKATMEIPSPVDGTLSQILKANGERVSVGDVLALIEEGAQSSTSIDEASRQDAPRVMPAAQLEMERSGVQLSAVTPTGPGGRVLKEDVLRTVKQRESPPAASTTMPVAPSQSSTSADIGKAPGSSAPVSPAPGTDRQVEIIPMTLLRRRIAERLVSAQQQAALLTTFNEIDLSSFLDLRRRVQDAFVARYGVKVGLMSIFVKAVIDALQRIPQVNAQIQGDAIAYHHYQDIGIAVGGGRGLVVPVLRNAQHLSLAEIEKAIADFAKRAQENRLELGELQGGTFTISNGGVYGSLMSTPIVNPPQSGVLGMHAIQDRPVARDGQVVIRPMMYVALTYDHRVVDGREAVTFLKRVKEVVEDPARLVLEA
jgi:2-oxoglutarate dehydrogenase E2 component (dihydrolipoamide succinyltransferase)